MLDTTNCARCGVRLHKCAGNDDARLLRRTTSDLGFCANCCATEFLQSLDVIGDPSRHAPPFDPRCLRLEHIQKQFATIMAAGKADARPYEIDWEKVIANWPLPFPKKPRKPRKLS